MYFRLIVGQYELDICFRNYLMIIKTKAYPRAGLIGNPSDGYFGKTISFSFSNYAAEVVLYESPELEIMPCQKDQSVFGSIHALVNDVELHGYYGGIRLLKATIKKFFDYCRENQIVLHSSNFTIRYKSNIPHGVGLAGSSAIITACMRALMAFYGVTIPKPVQAGLILSAEKEELHIAAGLQDRVIQVYEGMVHMDFAEDIMATRGCGNYEYLDYKLLPPVYIAYQEDLSEVSDVFHNNIRDRFNRKEKLVVDAMKYWAEITDKFKDALIAGQVNKLGPLLDANFDMRKKVYQISKANLEMIDTARSCGCSAKFTGSGGAIVGTYNDAKDFDKLKKSMKKIGVNVIKPRFVAPDRKEK